MLSNLAHWLTSSLLVVTIALVSVVSQARGNDLLIRDIKYPARHLPTNVQPLEYDLELTLLEGISVFNEGKVGIFVEFKQTKSRKGSCFGSRLVDKITKDKTDDLQPRDRIVLHAGSNIERITQLDITVGDSIETIRRGQGKSLPIKRIDRDKDAGTLVISLKNSLPEGSIGLITVAYFWGGQKLYDLRRQSEYDSYRVVRVVPGEARKMFPCFDEPHFKANVILTVSHAASEKSVAWQTTLLSSDMFTHQEHQCSMKRERFLKTPVAVPLHSIAFAIGPFDRTELYQGVSNRRQIRLMTEFNKIRKGRFAIEFAAEVAKWFEAYLERPMPTNLLLVAVPESESSSAGWDVIGGLGIGLINEKFLLVDSNSWVDDKTECLLHVALAVARQWFGSMLTSATAEDFWIPEGLAAYMAQRVVRQLRPDFQVDEFVASNRILQDNTFFKLNGAYEFATSVLNTNDRLRLFRGAQIIDMLRRDQTPSEADFDAIVRRLFGAPDGLDLVHFAAAFANEHVSDKKTVELIEKRIRSGNKIWIQLDVGNKQLVVKQLAAVLIPNALRIRLVFSGDSGTLVKDMKLNDFAQGKAEIKVELPENLHLEWAVAIEDDSGMLRHYRVSYSGELLERLAKAFESNEHALKPRDRLAIISDASDEAQTFGYEKGAPSEKARKRLLETIELYEHEKDFEVLLGVMRAIETYRNLFGKRKQFPSLAVHAEQMLFKRLGGLSVSRQEAPSKQRLKVALLNFLSLSGGKAIEEALALFDRTSLGSASLLGYLADPVHEIVKRSGSHIQRNRLYYRLSEGMKDPEASQKLWKQLGLGQMAEY